MTALKITNRDARRLWLGTHGLATAPTGAPGARSLIQALGFVQLDSIQVVSRAHHHILWSRNQSYRELHLHRLLARDRAVFEHFTHDASVLPIEFLPMWQRQFRRMHDRVARSSWYGDALDAGLLGQLKRRITEEGPLSSRDFETTMTGPRTMWQRPPHKKALDFLWYAGELATSHRDGFTKFYDLSDRVFPVDLRNQQISDRDQVDWLCHAALDRLGFGSLTEIRNFWQATDPAEVADWAARNEGRLVPVQIEGADGRWTAALACADIEQRLSQQPPPTSRLRILNPFDPAIRDRVRLKRLFGFDYTVEMFVPAAKRQWGYYVFPLLEGSRFVGRIEAKADRARNRLLVLNHWPEPGIAQTANRAGKLDAELQRLARFSGLETVEWAATARTGNSG